MFNIFGILNRRNDQNSSSKSLLSRSSDESVENNSSSAKVKLNTMEMPIQELEEMSLLQTDLQQVVGENRKTKEERDTLEQMAAKLASDHADLKQNLDVLNYKNIYLESALSVVQERISKIEVKMRESRNRLQIEKAEFESFVRTCPKKEEIKSLEKKISDMSLTISHLKEDSDAKEVERKKLQVSLKKFESYEGIKPSLIEKQNSVEELLRQSSEKVDLINKPMDELKKIKEEAAEAKIEKHSEMSNEEMKRNLRTQGKYSSDIAFCKNCGKQPEGSPGEQEQPERKSKKNGCKQNTLYSGSDNKSAVKYRANSSYFFNELEDYKKPIEIPACGKYVISETIDGKSVVLYEPKFIEVDNADYVLSALNDSTMWKKKNIIIQGLKYAQPRLVAWYGPFPYSYSGVTLEPKEMPENIIGIKRSVEDYLMTQKIDVTFNSVLLDCYRNGRDSVSWHSDDELSLGVCPTIASVYLGETRKFEMRRKIKPYEDDSQIDQYYVNVTHGSLLFMTGNIQQDWQHRIPKEYHDKGRMINLTFRTIYPV